MISGSPIQSGKFPFSRLFFYWEQQKRGWWQCGVGGFWQDTRQDIRALMSAADTFYCAALCWEFDTMSSWATAPRGKGHQSHVLPAHFYCDRQYFCAYTSHWYYCSLSPVSRFQEEPSALDFCSCYISADIWRFRNWSIYEDKSTIWLVYDHLNTKMMQFSIKWKVYAILILCKKILEIIQEDYWRSYF